MGLFADLIKHLASLLSLITSQYDEQVIKEGLHECCLGTRRIYKALKNASSIGEKQHLITVLSHIKSLRNQFKLLRKHGAGFKKPTIKTRVHWDESISAFDSRIRTGIISNLKHKDPRDFLNDCQTIFKRRVQNVLKNNEAVKINSVFCGEFQIVKGDRLNKEHKYFTTSNAPIYRNTNIDEWFKNKIENPILTELEEFQERDSGWALSSIVNLQVNINKFTPQLVGSSYIELPPQIARKHACINVKNKDQACFAWSIIAALYPVGKHPQRVSKYPSYSKILKLKGITFPITMKQIPNFEQQNDISVNVYILKNKYTTFSTLPTYLTKHKKDKHVNLLLIQNHYFDDVKRYNTPIKYHYVWIKHLSRLLSTQLSHEEKRKYVCDRCLHYFRSQDRLNNHIKECEKLNDCAIKMPEIGKNILKFKNFRNKEMAPFIVYADLESILRRTENSQKNREHIPAVIGYYFKCSFDDSLSFYRSYSGPTCVQWFVDQINQLAQDVETVFWCSFDIDMTSIQEAKFQKSTHCHICNEMFLPNDKKVRDHNHLIPTNNFRGAAHQNCNINFTDTHVIPIVFHNMTCYDANFIISDICTRIQGKIDLLLINKEKYISFTKHINGTSIQFRFIDSFRFMSSSLDALSSFLTEFPNSKSQFFELSDEDFRLLTQKGVMPYDYIDSFERFEERDLPPIEAFYNRLNDKPCPQRMYQRAHLVWNRFNCQSLGAYVELYMKTDILLLADVFEQFRSSCLKTYELDPAHYFTLPGYTWDAMLKYTKQELELLTDGEMFLFVEQGIRGGLSQICSKRRAHANNKYLPTYDSNQATSYLMYYDINNQYGWSMSQFLPYGEFEWVNTNIDVLTIPDDDEEGFILEVDVEYPRELHDAHKDLPFCPEHINPNTGKAPKSTKELSKLMATLHNKEKYIIHYRNLKQILQRGLKVTKIHRAVKFKQSAWLKPYIDLNTELRKNAKNEFEKNLYKLMNNAVFGKTMENIRKRVNVSLHTKWLGRYGAQSFISKPEFKSCTVFNENLVAIELRKLQIYLSKPIYVGMSILDIAKTSIYDFHYGYIHRTFSESILLYTDTDSLIYETSQDPYEAIKRNCNQYFDTSDYPPNNAYGIPLLNKKALGLMKDENCGIPMIDFVGLRSKLYATKVLTTEEELARKQHQLQKEGYDNYEIDLIKLNYGTSKKAKGVKKYVVQSKITFDDYIECLEKWCTKTVSQNLIQSEKHHVYSIRQEKIALSPYDDKRCLLPESNNTLPHGHYNINPRLENS